MLGPNLLSDFWKSKNFKIFRNTPKFFLALQYIKNWTKVVPWNFFCYWKKKILVQKKTLKKKIVSGTIYWPLDSRNDSTPRILTSANLEALSEIFLPLSLCSSRTSSTSRLSSTSFASSNTLVTLSIEVCWSFSLGSTVLLEVGEFISLSNSTSDSSKAESSAALSYSWSLWKTKRNV